VFALCTACSAEKIQNNIVFHNSVCCHSEMTDCEACTELFSGYEYHIVQRGTKYVPPEPLTAVWKHFQLLKCIFLEYYTVENTYKLSH
jgi:hypothetical protein